MNAEAIDDSQNCRITLYVVDWIIIQTVCLCCLKPVPVLDIHLFGRRNDLVGWLVGFAFNGPLRHYFSLYRAASQREGERGKKG